MLATALTMNESWCAPRNCEALADSEAPALAVVLLRRTTRTLAVGAWSPLNIVLRLLGERTSTVMSARRSVIEPNAHQQSTTVRWGKGLRRGANTRRDMWSGAGGVELALGRVMQGSRRCPS